MSKKHCLKTGDYPHHHTILKTLMQKISTALKSVFDTALRLLFPTKCISCNAEGTTLCDNCVQKIPTPEPPHDSFVSSMFDYHHPITKHAIWMLKFRGDRTLAKLFARVIHDHLLEDTSDKMIFENFRHPLLVPIPLTKKRLKKRGFNQSEAIARELSFIDIGGELEFEKNVLLKIHDTPPQTSLKDKRARARNVKDCYSVADKKMIRDRNVILIDDVTTTGATLREARKVLLAGGARKVYAFTVAH